jgi:hypothetical protein
MPAPGRSTTIAIIGGTAVVGNALSLLLRGHGYEADAILEEGDGGVAEKLLDGVDVLLLAPGPSDALHEAFLESKRSAPETARIPVLTLSTHPAEETAKVRGDGSVVVPWPNRIENLTREIEAALLLARSANGQGALSVCGCGRRDRLASAPSSEG